MESFGKLRRVDVSNCDKMKNLFSFSIARKLEEINVSECKMMEMVVYHGSEDAAHGNINNEAISEKLEFPQLRSLNLNSLSNLVFFWSGLETTCGSSLSDSRQPLFGEKVVFPSLKKLGLSGMNFRELWSTTSCMQNLSSLDVSSCPNLKYLFTVAMAGGLPQLETLKIRGCHVMEEVFVTNEHGEGRLEKDSFPKLKYVVLVNLPNLRRFCTGDCIECPSLLELEINNCGELRKFISSNEEEVEGPFFNEKVSFPILKYLRLERLNLKILWTDQLSITFPKLEELRISGCKEMEAVFVTKEPIEEGTPQKIPFPKLKNLQLWDLQNIRRFCAGCCSEFPSLTKTEIARNPAISTFITDSCNKASGELMGSEAKQPLFNGKVAFPKLEKLSVRDLNSVNSLFSFAFAKSLVTLKELEVWRCSLMEEIVQVNEQGEEGRLDKISFPKLESIDFYGLSNLKRFYDGARIEFPSLLKSKITAGKETEEIMDRVVLGPTSSKSMLTHLYEDSEYFENSYLESLKLLFIQGHCYDRLKSSLLSSTTSFQNLMALVVSECSSMINLLASSSAKTLVHLRLMSITECKQMTEIIADEIVDDEIVFSKLKILELSDLPSLRSFHSVGNSVMRFPNLVRLAVSQCPEMRRFSFGTIDAPNLDSISGQKVMNTWDSLLDERDFDYWMSHLPEPQQKLWEGDINKTIEKLWVEDSLVMQRLFTET